MHDNSATQCSNPVSGQSAVITVNPQPVITAKTATAACNGSFSVIPINGTDIVPAGTTYSWSAPTGIGFNGGAAGTNQPLSAVHLRIQPTHL